MSLKPYVSLQKMNRRDLMLKKAQSCKAGNALVYSNQMLKNQMSSVKLLYN